MPEDVATLTLSEVADLEATTVSRVRQQLRDGQLIALTIDGARRVPTQFLQDRAPVKHLPGVITLLRDGGYDDQQIVDWLYRCDPSLPGAPIDALRANRGTEIKRRAQAAAF